MVAQRIRSSLESEATTWFSIIQDTCHSFDEFRAMFLQKYWGEVVQSKIRTNLTMGKFDPSKTSSREEYKPKYRNNHAHVNRPLPPPFRRNGRYNNEYRQTNNNLSTSRNGNISSHVSQPTHFEENDVTKARTDYPADLNAIQVVEADVYCEPSTNEHFLG
ncbi:hypothetical protein Trydic_g13963 [Trypoxylus dichotomus]